MPQRKAGDNNRGPKRRNPLTVQELRSLLDPYEDDDSADVMFQDQKNHAILRRLYASLRYFTDTLQREEARLKSITKADIDVPNSVSRKFPSWLQDPHLFWWPVLPHSVAPETPFTTDIYRQRFVQAAIQQYQQLQLQRVVARFTSIVLYLSFQRVFPRERVYLQTHSIQKYLHFMGCENTQNTITSCKSIITAGKRRLMFCDALARTDYNTSQSERLHDSIEEALDIENCRRTLGLCFLDVIPDSMQVSLRPKESS